jgi:hypothetical protein
MLSKVRASHRAMQERFGGVDCMLACCCLHTYSALLWVYVHVRVNGLQ